MKSIQRDLLVAAVFLGTPSVAHANAGTPLMWATMSHLVFGNAIIGVIEGLLLAAFFRTPKGRTIVWMIVANYFSAWVGLVWLADLLNHRTDVDLYNAGQMIWQMMAIAFVATLLLEWPIVAICLRAAPHWFRRSVAASFLIQSVSYAALFLVYRTASVDSLLTDAIISSRDQMVLPPNVLVYYISSDDGDVYRQHLSGGPLEKVCEFKSTNPENCLILREGNFEGERVIHAMGVSTQVAIPNEMCPLEENGEPLGRSLAVSPRMVATKLGSAKNSDWTVIAGFWPAQGLSGENSKTKEQFRVALEVPFLRWSVRHAMILPGDQILFQLGLHQVCIYDPHTRKIAVLYHGHGALAVLADAEANREMRSTRALME